MSNPHLPGSLELDDITPIDDFSNETLLALAERLERSESFQEFIAREVELDEVWRRVETAMKAGAEEGMTTQAMSGLSQLFALVQEAHDLAGISKPLEASSKLRAAMTLQPLAD
jgi:hypothetical protein